MSLELAIVISVAIICGTVVAIFKPAHIEQDEHEKLLSLEEKISQLEANRDSLQKLAEETKKMLSQEQLSRSIRR